MITGEWRSRPLSPWSRDPALELRLELGGGQIAEAHVGVLLILVAPPALSADLGIDTIAEPF